MKTLTLRFLLVSALVAFGVFVTPARAQQNNTNSNDRMERLERRINEIAQRQQQMMQQRDGRQQAPGQPPRFEGMRQPHPGFAPPPQIGKTHKGLKGIIGLVMLCCILFNILIAIWIFSDIRRRGTGSGIFIVLALIAGIPTAIIYCLVRIGDNKLIEPVVRAP
ncbi:MAG: hypothetical protein ACXWBP_08490 [Limisphaerales bacterium]